MKGAKCKCVPEPVFTPMLTWAENRQRRGRQIQGQAGGLLKLSLSNICICFERKKPLYPQEIAHVFCSVLYTWGAAERVNTQSLPEPPNKNRP